MLKVKKARIYVDFHEMVDYNIVLLSQHDAKIDSEGNKITFYEGMPVSIYSDDFDLDDQIDNLIAEGIAIKYDFSDYYPHWQHVKWCCLIDEKGIIHESDLEDLKKLESYIMTDFEIHSIKDRCNRATKGPWEAFIKGINHHTESSFIRTQRADMKIEGASDFDRRFIAHARQDIPLLINEIYRLRKLLDCNQVEVSPTKNDSEWNQ